MCRKNFLSITGHQSMKGSNPLVRPAIASVYITDVDLSVSQSAQSLSHVRLFVAPWTTTRQASLSITNSWSLSKLMFTE